MDTAKLWFTLFCVCGSWILSLALDCDWTTEYDKNNRCCKACPSGEYPTVPCSENNVKGVCEKCPPASSDVWIQCVCKENHVCSDDKCSSCLPRTICEPGHQLRRVGKFQFSFLCEKCPNGTYNDAKDSKCKSITKCVGVGEAFPGNQTHNARCVSPESTSQNPLNETQTGSQFTHYFMMACLTVTVLTCLVFIMYTALKIAKYKMLIKLNKPSSHGMVLPSDDCSCKLSTEEEGDKHYTKTEDLI